MAAYVGQSSPKLSIASGAIGVGDPAFATLMLEYSQESLTPHGPNSYSAQLFTRRSFSFVPLHVRHKIQWILAAT